MNARLTPTFVLYANTYSSLATQPRDTASTTRTNTQGQLERLDPFKESKADPQSHRPRNHPPLFVRVWCTVQLYSIINITSIVSLQDIFV